MATVTVTITESDVLNQVGMRASFEGRTAVGANGEALYDSIRTTAQDTPLLSKFLDDGRENLLATYPDIAAASSGNIVYTIDSTEWDTNLATPVQAQTIAFLVNYICRRWFELRLPSVVQSYQDRAALCIINLSTMLYIRKAPTYGSVSAPTEGLIDLTTT